MGQDTAPVPRHHTPSGKRAGDAECRFNRRQVERERDIIRRTAGRSSIATASVHPPEPVVPAVRTRAGRLNHRTQRRDLRRVGADCWIRTSEAGQLAGPSGSLYPHAEDYCKATRDPRAAHDSAVRGCPVHIPPFVRSWFDGVMAAQLPQQRPGSLAMSGHIIFSAVGQWPGLRGCNPSLTAV